VNAIEVKGLTKSYDGQPVLKEISMTVARGDVYGFLGPNGAGKTTTLRILLGILARDGGDVAVLGEDPLESGHRLRQQVNVLPESHGFYAWMRADDYLRFFAGLYGRRLASSECRTALAQVGLDPGDRRPIRTFSRGMKQRLGIARSFLNNPQLLFLDEPTNGLDPKGRRDIHDLLLALNRDQGVTIVISTHILDDVERLCNRIAILDHGRITYEGLLGEVTEATSKRYRFRIDAAYAFPLAWAFPGVPLLERSGNWLSCSIEGMTPAQAIRTLVDGGLPVIEVGPVTGGLEGLYLSHIEGGVQ
jgi:ABC-2 type transport system ATP-binding protein